MARSLEMTNDEFRCKFYFVSTRKRWTYLQVDSWLLLARCGTSKRFAFTLVYIGIVFCSFHRTRAQLDACSIDLLTMSLDSAPKVLFRYSMNQCEFEEFEADMDEERMECEASFRWAMTRTGTCKRACASAPSDAAGMYEGRMHSDTRACMCLHARNRCVRFAGALRGGGRATSPRFHP